MARDGHVSALHVVFSRHEIIFFKNPCKILVDPYHLLQHIHQIQPLKTKLENLGEFRDSNMLIFILMMPLKASQKHFGGPFYLKSLLASF
jgi:hypothetical protein